MCFGTVDNRTAMTGPTADAWVIGEGGYIPASTESATANDDTASGVDYIDMGVSGSEHADIVTVGVQHATDIVTKETGEEENSTLDAPLVFRALYLSVGIVGMCGNMMVVVVILSSKRMRRTITNKFICNQSLLDFSASFFIAFTAFFREAGSIPPGIMQELFCRLWLTNWPLWGVFVSSTYNLVALTFERYFAILYPFRHSQSFTKTKAYIIMVIVWFIGPIYLGSYGITSSTVKDGKCTVYSEWPNELSQRAVGTLTVFIQYFTPLFAITFAYIRIFLTLRKSGRETSNGSTNDLREERISKAKRNVIKTLAQVFACFVFCWSWNQFFYALFNFGYPVEFESTFYHFTVLCVFLNSCMNPFVYSVNYDQFKTAQRALFCTRCLKQPKPRMEIESDSASHGYGGDAGKPTTKKKAMACICWSRDAVEGCEVGKVQKTASVSTIMTNRSDNDKLDGKPEGPPTFAGSQNSSIKSSLNTQKKPSEHMTPTKHLDIEDPVSSSDNVGKLSHLQDNTSKSGPHEAPMEELHISLSAHYGRDVIGIGPKKVMSEEEEERVGISTRL